VQKRNFLASKGLSDDEIQKAFERVGIFTSVNSIENSQNITDDSVINIPQNQVQTIHYKHQMTTFEKIKDVLSSVALISGIAYSVYMLYKVS
jgi:peroxin-14